MLKIELQSALHSVELTKILNHDPELQEMSNGKIITPAEFVAYNTEWSAKHHAQLYAIVKENLAIGSISLAHIDYEKQTASCGYWLTSAEWGKGHTTEAFKLIIVEAQRQNLHYLTSKIKKDNVASLKIWQKYNPEYQYSNDKYHLKINV